MLRFGSAPPDTREMDLDDIFFARLKLLIVMAKAYLEGCAMGRERCRAMLENARHVEAESIDLGGLLAGFAYHQTPSESVKLDHVFYQRVKLLAVMVKAIAKGFPMGDHRKEALQENLDMICETLAYDGQLEQLRMIKVA
jgi:hypothetical protein